MSNYGQNPPNPNDPQGSYGDQPTSPYGQQPPAPDQGSYGQGGYGSGGYGSGGYQQQGGYGQGGPGGVGTPSRKGFFGALFDLSFTTFVTPMIIKVVYILGLIGIGIGTLFFAFSGFFGDSPGVGIVTMILAPLVGLLYLCFFRMMCEFYVAITRMSEDINRRLPQG
ncbi:DUF4282 domain-containing protein [Nocardioides seonyuensis]|uniref:DUF4282 domain-containing protein n=1 Tax=Nocardioides seonyuensis TaxID=2518371 RepID=A0A4P7IHE3_9ACTN|nr:DUF4282 domain-containing protein [Nocardioides seonyuensis]QBX55577.1 DUF4282 domain-containing protein [Nocardioides seonyuensis]